MAQTVNLAPGMTVATSTDIIVGSGLEAVIGIYTESGMPLSDAGQNFFATVVQVTPGEPSRIDKLDAATPAIKVSGPNTYRVIRGAALVNVGVFSE